MAQRSPVLTIDGPSGVGKGTASRLIANKMGWHYLDSGALYRAVAVLVTQRGINVNDIPQIVDHARNMSVHFSSNDGSEPRVWLGKHDITDALRLEQTGLLASQLAALPEVREALMSRQREFRDSPGLVADGRDMGTTVFPDAICKIFLTASTQERAKRRYKQLKEKGVSVSLGDLLQEISVRDDRDAQREVSPLKPADDAVVIDTTTLAIEAVVSQILLRVAMKLSEK